MIKIISYESSWVRNIVFGCILLGIILIQVSFGADIPGMPVQSNSSIVVMYFISYFFVFLNNHFVVRLLLFKKKYAYYTIVTIIYVFALTIVTGYLNKIFVIPSNFIFDFLSSFIIALIGTAIYFMHIWILNSLIKSQKILLDTQAELTFLKHQLSPHFLFNAINNLYGTALASPEIIADKLLELSNLLRYQIESTTKDVVTITDEMNFIENYISYTKYKTNNLNITTKIIGEINPVFLPPLLFLPLIENAIKYSAETENAFIYIYWIFDKNKIVFRIENSYLANGSKIRGTKVGIENLNKRLALSKLKHELNIDTSAINVYKTELKLWKLSINV